MKAIVREKFGSSDVLELREVPRPSPKADEVLIKVHVTHISTGDSKARSGKTPWPLMRVPARMMMGIVKPKQAILGGEFSGQVVDVGERVSRFQIGDEVFGFTGMQFGAFAEWVAMPEHGMITHKPDNVSPENAAAIGPIHVGTSLCFMQKANIKPGHKVLINGASGGLGRPAVLLAKHFGAEVTGVCSTAKMDMVRALGADEVIDYTQEDFTRNGKRYDIIFDMADLTPFAKFKDSLTPSGIHILAMFGLRHLWQMYRTSGSGGKRVICGLGSESPEVLDSIRDLMAGGALVPIIDKIFPLERTAEASRYIDNGEHRGSVLVSIDNEIPAEARARSERELAAV
ncbi:NAD(P)-dependent alcohol dehydrogenase [Sulfidibacter corallicola]|uniref:NAD(P)-dependent alcohol dehydrogenase n=1 Tax=Sulfidibacter corallicola TaxID=2818388 RepID=A0A8A4TNK5_SULCO|nr:NAD(P)-dependent alcohol dehydrogenase [Sulfidibacter corallicola]QTD50682.1 NAD(P)-dependent alcohol dehydrogenase [Sulfidibacter corallicola]